MQLLRSFFVAVAALFLLPLAVHAAWWISHDPDIGWSEADWSSAGILPPARATPGAVVRVYAARTGRWKGAVAVHTWIVIKERGASAYTRFDKTGWGRPVKVNGWAPDARWYGHAPFVVAAFDGPAAERLIPKIKAAVARYPFNSYGAYSVWPGPNSNSFVAYVLNAVPEAQVTLPPTAIGKDWHADLRIFGLAPSHTGIQLSLGGLLGFTLGWVEGIEINVLGLVAGIDIRHPALKLPGFGRIGFRPAG
ncbi:MAG TPA: DUF3750 domain-containing protein [Hyphomicrobiaceae bacterium]|nr:DUF3750 domain-containing protein [Hyphomicrobiaceae bacterium]